MVHNCTSHGCEFSLPDSYPLPKCPWRTWSRASKNCSGTGRCRCGFGGGLAYKKFKTYLHKKQLRKERQERRQRVRPFRHEQKISVLATELLQSLETATQTKESRNEIEATSARSVIRFN